ncbi:MAG: SPOR domain-containing protein [bacterium]
MKVSRPLPARLACGSTMRQQGGKILLIVLILIVGGLFFLSYHDPNKPMSLPNILPNSSSPQTIHTSAKGDSPKPAVYTVQVAATADKGRAYEIKEAFVNDGYQPRVDVIDYGRDSVMYKVRIGTYLEEMEAKQLRDKIQRAYRENYRDSFVYAY